MRFLIRTILTGLFGWTFLVSTTRAVADNLSAFPAAAPKMVRHVLELPEYSHEEDMKVELIVGQSEWVDVNNHYFFAGSIVEGQVPGWGYPFYSVEQMGNMAGTLMAVDPNLPKRRQLIRLGGGPYLIRYNSRLPVVVYVPLGAEVHYRIWKTQETINTIPPG